MLASAEYLNANIWHYNLPDGNKVSPDTIEHIRDTYNYIAQASGFVDASGYFEYIFTRLQLPNEKPLVVMSLHPYQGAINHSEDKTIRVIDEFITSAVERLQKAGMNIVHYYADSQMQDGQSPHVSRHDNFFLECRKGNARLLRTHTHLTNF